MIDGNTICCECGEHFNSSGSSRSGGPWPYSWEPDDDTCPGCNGDARCDTDDCPNKGETRKNVDGVLRRYAVLCKPCLKEWEDEEARECG